MPFWYNIRTHQVESDDRRSQNKDVMGPYATEEAARRALETARERSERWDEEDREWDDWGAERPATWDDSDVED